MPRRYVHPQTDHVTFRPARYVHWTNRPLWQFTTVTLRPCDIFLLWHSDSVTFSTVTFRLKVDRLSIHPKKWTFCHTVTFRPTVILANPWLRHFVHFGFPFLRSIPCPSCRWFWQMTISWHYPFNLWTSTHWFGRLRSGRGYSKGVFLRLFFWSDRSFGSYGDF